MNRTFYLISAVSVTVAFALVGCDDPPKPTPKAGPSAAATTTATTKATATASASASASAKAFALPSLPYLPAMVTPKDNPLSQAAIDLGKVLFFDPRLGKDGKFACENCHYPNKGWADAQPFSMKANGKYNVRHTPALYNVGYQKAWYWEGRAATLEKQVIAAWKGQMGGDVAAAVQTLSKLAGYKPLFNKAFGDDKVTSERVVKALASFVRSIRSGDAPWDRYEKGDKKAVSEAAVRGWEVFRLKAGCASCHAPPLFTDNLYHNVGVGYDKPNPDEGRFKVSKDDKDKGKFKTPSLRSVTLHAPYLHNGSAATLDAAVDYMLSGGHKNPNLDSAFKKIPLSPEQRSDLMAFIKALEGKRAAFVRPELPQ